MGNKINDTTAFPVKSSSSISINDILIGSTRSTGVTNNFAIGDLVAAVVTSSYKKVTLSSASSYQDNDFVGASYIMGFVAGSEALTSNVISAFNSTTGTVTFNPDYGTVTGEVIFIIVGGTQGASIKNADFISATITSTTTYQNNDLIGASNIMAWLDGFEVEGAGLVNGGIGTYFNSSTGTITFNATQSGKLRIIYI